MCYSSFVYSADMLYLRGMKKVIIVGAGAAGCFAAIELRRCRPDVEVSVLESGQRALAKVMITGGGRCNLTNSFRRVTSLERVYPRGHRLLKRLFHCLGPEATQRWWEQEGVRLVTQEDECVFPRSQRAGEIVETLLRLMQESGVILWNRARVESIKPLAEAEAGGKWELATADGRTWRADCVLVSVGGKFGELGKNLENLGVKMEAPVPSLFSFCLPGCPLTGLPGLVVESASVGIAGTKFAAGGALLLTHWGVSGPAVLKLSSFAARYLAEHDYQCPLIVNWLSGYSEDEVRDLLLNLKAQNPQKQLLSMHPAELQSRLWQAILTQSGLNAEQRWSDLNGKALNKLVTNLTASTYRMDGKNRFKDEFVTCGGVALGQLNANTLEHKALPGLYFAGEAMDVDAVTGGFNLQAAWTTGYVAAQSIAEKE